MTEPGIAVIGVGATGAHCVRALVAMSPDVIVACHDRRADRVVQLQSELGPRVRPCGPLGGDASIVVLAGPAGTHGSLAAAAIGRRAAVVSLTDSIDDVRDLFDLDGRAQEASVPVVVGAGFAPGLTCLLARHAGDALDEVVEISVAKAGTGGPACARQHHSAMQHVAWDWFDGSWVERRGGSGRDLVWFPPPIGARDAYKAALPSPLLLQRTYPDAARIVARVAATRRDRLTSRLPMLRRPHDDGGPGAVRVEVRGRVDGRFETLVYAVAADPSRGAGTVGAIAASAAASRALRSGAFGLSEVDDPLTLLQSVLDAGLRITTFEGSGMG